MLRRFNKRISTQLINPLYQVCVCVRVHVWVCAVYLLMLAPGRQSVSLCSGSSSCPAGSEGLSQSHSSQTWVMARQACQDIIMCVSVGLSGRCLLPAAPRAQFTTQHYILEGAREVVAAGGDSFKFNLANLDARGNSISVSRHSYKAAMWLLCGTFRVQGSWSCIGRSGVLLLHSGFRVLELRHLF